MQTAGTVRKLCSVLFPVSYSDKFYNDVLLPEVAQYCQLGAPARLHVLASSDRLAQYFTTTSLSASSLAGSSGYKTATTRDCTSRRSAFWRPIDGKA
jgi:hypothetical protein